MTGFIGRLRRASRRSPQYLLKRVLEIVVVKLRRPWATILPRIVTANSVVKAVGADSVDTLWERQQKAPFFVAPSDREEWAQIFRARFPEAPALVVAAADQTLRHEFDLLGSGPVDLGPRLPWHTDFKSGREWPLQFSPNLNYQELDRPTDVKVPWELSRCQHFTALGQAYWLTGDERYPREFVDETSDWMARNPWGHGVNWACAMDVALRAVSWIWGFYYMGGSAACASGPFRGEFLRVLYLHGEFIAAYLERADLNGNHYLCDGVGLIFVGAFFRSAKKGRRWLALGKEIVFTEIFNQTTDDGVDFEKSTAYHRLVLEAFLTCGLLLDRLGEPPPVEWRTRLERMLEFVEAYVKPDGLVPLIGDADDGRVQKLGPQPLTDHRYLLSTGAAVFDRGDFKRAAGRLYEETFWLLGPDAVAPFDTMRVPGSGSESMAFPDGGFFVLRSSRAHVVVDCGEVGMRGRGGHGHNDMLGFELWLDGTNFVTDCGAYLYTASREWRNRFRSTAFHNVVQVDDEELNRFLVPDNLWQLQDDARPRDVVWQPGENVDYFRGSHSGYLRLNPPVAVTREIALVKDGPAVFVRDSIDGAGSRELTWRFHLAPLVSAEIRDGDVRLTSGGAEAWLQWSSPMDRLAMTIEDGWASPSYGVRTAIRVVVLKGRVTLPQSVSCRFGGIRMAPDLMKAMGASLFAADVPARVGVGGG
ncbi:MAG: alginate lyase family protein [Acidobacteriota bacterium]